MWDQISTFLLDQSDIGPFKFENWMMIFGLPAVVLILLMAKRD
jgi:hypothetical protein